MAKMVAATVGQLNHIGRAGENLATIVSFDVCPPAEPPT